MTSLNFSGDITLDDVFSQHRIIIYDNVVEAIQANFENLELDEITAVKIMINRVEYSVRLSRSKFVSSLKSAISFYEKIEEYEKCQKCLDIIEQLEEKEKNVHN